MKTVVKPWLALLLLIGGWGSAHAVPCGVAGVSPNAGCQNGSGSNASEAAVNGFFGTFGWQLIDKTDDATSGAAYWSGDFTGPSGDFMLVSDFWSNFLTAMVVLKDGGSTTNSDIKWSAYLLAPGTLSYTWNYDTRKDISYLGLYVIRGGTTVPEPESLGLMGLGLLLIGVARRRLHR